MASSKTVRSYGGKVIKYAVLPGILPRIRELVGSGFSQLAFMMALVYGMVRLLPQGHPYLNSANIGRYGLINVIAEAANNLVISKDNIDKLIIFVVLLFGLMILFMQFFSIMLFLTMGSALAGDIPRGFSDLFEVNGTNRPYDIAYIALDMVFGVQRNGGASFFESCLGAASGGGGATGSGANCSSDGNSRLDFSGSTFPWPFHTALHSMFQLYSIGMLVVAVIIFLYFIVTIVAETAQSGTPFGRRFNQVWAPIRMVVAFGLLIPLNSGLNTAQYITLYSAKIGSAFATNAWVRFSETLTDPAIFGEANAGIVARTRAPQTQNILMFSQFAYMCKLMQDKATERTGDSTRWARERVQAYWLKGNSAPAKQAGGAGPAIDHFQGRDVTIVFGIQDGDTYASHPGKVLPLCGKIVIPVATRLDQPAALAKAPGTREMFEFYYDMVVNDFYGSGYATGSKTFIDTLVAQRFLPTSPGVSLGAAPPNTLIEMATSLQKALIGQIQTVHENVLNESSQAMLNRIQDIQEKGWAGAALWFNAIAEMNGAFVDGVQQIPRPIDYPELIEVVIIQMTERNQAVSGSNPFCNSRIPEYSSLTGISRARYGAEMYNAYRDLCSYWMSGAPAPAVDEGGYFAGNRIEDSNFFIQIINVVFGTAGLFALRDNDNVHPMAKMTALGKGLINSTIRQMLGGLALMGIQIGSGVFGASTLDSVAGTASSFMFSLATIGLTAGFILYYVLAFLPFIYFFFAFTGWIKGIFEAMVGMPLWALAHMRIDGEGLPGDAAVSGYFLILEIFIRPILILFGLLLSLLIFSAMANILNDIFDIVVFNAGGGNAAVSNPGVLEIEYWRNPIDKFFFTVMYAVIMYLLGLSAFKAIDLVPNNMLRWMGQNVQSFNDQRQDQAQGLTQYAAIGGSQTFGQLTGGLQQLSQAGQRGSAGAQLGSFLRG